MIFLFFFYFISFINPHSPLYSVSAHLSAHSSLTALKTQAEGFIESLTGLVSARDGPLTRVHRVPWYKHLVLILSRKVSQLLYNKFHLVLFCSRHASDLQKWSQVVLQLTPALAGQPLVTFFPFYRIYCKGKKIVS